MPVEAKRGLKPPQQKFIYFPAPVARRQVPVAIEKSGISHIITLRERAAADELRRWLKDQRCRVGPVFEPDPERFCFYVYSRRRDIRDLIAKHPGFLPAR